MRSQVLHRAAQELTDSMNWLTQQLLVIDASDYASALRAYCDYPVTINAGSLMQWLCQGYCGVVHNIQLLN